MKKKYLLSFLSLSLSLFLQAQTWDGSASTNWNTASNWSTNAVPTAAGNVIIPGSLTNYPVLANNVTINSMDMRLGSQLDFKGFNLTIITTAGAFTTFTGATLNNSKAGSDINVSISTAPGYHTYLRGTTVNDNIIFNMSGPAGLYEADNSGGGNHYTGNFTINFDAMGALYLSSGDTSFYNKNLTINRTGAGLTDAFNSGGIIGGNFSFTNNTAGNSLFGSNSYRTTIAGIINISINDTLPSAFEVQRLINQTAGGTINVQNSRGFNVEKDTLLINALSITGYRGADFGTMYNNDITANVTIADGTANTAGYHTYIRSNEVTGNAAFTINSNNNLYDADNTGGGNHYTGDVSFTAKGTGAFYISSADTSLYDKNLTINRPGAGLTDAFNSGAIIGGNFSFTNNTAGNSLFGSNSYRTTIAGMVNISINDTLPSAFEVQRLINQTTGGSINVQNSRGFNVEKDTLLVNALSITGYRGSDFGTLYNNDITGNVTIADGAANTAGYHTYIRSNEITGNAAFTINSDNNLYEADNSGGGNHYTGDVSFTPEGIGAFYISSSDTSLYDGNLTINRTGAGLTDAFNSGGIIGGDFTFTNNTAGNSLFGNAGDRTSIAGMINISINDTLPSAFELVRLINQTAGGSINVQSSRGFDVQRDTLLVSSMSITGYSGNAFGTLYNNDITGNITIADSAANSAGYHTYIRSNEITGNAAFTINSANNLYDADNSGGGNHYSGNVSYQNNGSLVSVGAGDTTLIGQNLILNSPAGITLTKIKLNGIANGALEQLGTQPIIISQLIMEKTGTGNITLNDSVTVSNELTFNGGNIISNLTNPLKFLDNATQTGASDASHVNGIVTKIGNDAFSFPVGSGTSLNSVAMTAPAAGSEFSAQYFQKNPALDGYDTSQHAAALQRVSGCEYWDVKREIGSSNVTLTFTFAHPCSGSPNYISDPAQARIAHWTGTTWEDLGNGGSTGTTTGTVTTGGPVSSFSPFTFGSTDVIANPLPVTLLSFRAAKDKDKTKLNWRTTDERNLSHFEIEKSTDGVSYSIISHVSAVNTPGNHDYEVYDVFPTNGINYYRLKIVDFDGRSKYSQVARLDFKQIAAAITIFPNPANKSISVQGLSSFKHLRIINGYGKTVMQKIIKNNTETIDISSLSPGIYLVQLINDNETTSIRLIKQY